MFLRENERCSHASGSKGVGALAEFKIFVTSFVLAMIFCIGGCGGDDAAMLARVAKLEEEIADLQKENEELKTMINTRLGTTVSKTSDAAPLTSNGDWQKSVGSPLHSWKGEAESQVQQIFGLPNGALRFPIGIEKAMLGKGHAPMDIPNEDFSWMSEPVIPLDEPGSTFGHPFDPQSA